jgi:hypothetical protein
MFLDNLILKQYCVIEIMEMYNIYVLILLQQVVPGRQQTITIHDTPSPAVSVITISDSEDEAPGKW